MRKGILTTILILICIIFGFGEESGVLKGHVYYLDENNPVKGGAVEIKELGIKTITDDNGFFSFENIKPGNYSIIVTNPDYFDGERDWDDRDWDDISVKPKEDTNFSFIVGPTTTNSAIHTRVPSHWKTRNVYLFSLPSAYILPKGQMRVQLTYNFNPYQTYYDFQESERDNYYEEHDFYIRRITPYGMRIDVGLTKILQLGLSYSKYGWKYDTGFKNGDEYYYYDDYIYSKREYSQTTIDCKFTLVKIPELEISTFFRYSIIEIESHFILKLPPESIDDKSKVIYSEGFVFPIIFSTTFPLNENFSFTFSFSFPLLQYLVYIHDVRQTWGGMRINYIDKISIGYENRMNYFTEYIREGAGTGEDVSYRISSETKYFLTWNFKNFQLQGCYLIHKGSKYFNFEFNEVGFALVYKFNVWGNNK
jgi:hypothetical protein